MSTYNNLNFSLSMKTNKFNRRTDDFTRQTEPTFSSGVLLQCSP